MFSFQRGGGSIDLLFAGSSPSQGPAGQVTRGALSASWLRPAPPPPPSPLVGHREERSERRCGAPHPRAAVQRFPPSPDRLAASQPGFCGRAGIPAESRGARRCRLLLAGLCGAEPRARCAFPALPAGGGGGGGFPPLHPGCNSCPAAVSQRSCGSGQGVQEGSGVPGHGALPGAAGGCAWGERSRARLCCRLASSGGSG